MCIQILATQLIYFSPPVTLIHLSVSLDLCLSVSHLLFRSLITVSGPEGVFPLGWQQQGDRERETGRASSGEAWQTPLVIFPPPPIDSVSSGSVLAGPPSSEWLDNMPSSAISGNLSQARLADRSRSKGGAFIIALPLSPLFTVPFLLDFVPVVPASFYPFLLEYTTNPLESKPDSLLGSD